MKKRILFILSLLLLFSCGKSKFKRSTFLEELYTYKIAPEISDANSQIDQFANSWSNLTISPSAIALEKSQNQFEATLAVLDHIQFYNLGEISQTYIYNKFNKTAVDTALMWEFYNSHITITTNDIASLPNNQKGIYAIEYLIYSYHAQDSIYSSKYRSWISLYIEDLIANTTTLEDSWVIYQKNFTETLDNGVEGSFNIVCNRIIHMLEDIIDKRLDPVITSADPDQSVGHYSDSGLKSVKIQFEQLYNVFMGKGTQDFHSIYNYLHKKKRKLADEVQADFEDLISYQNSLAPSMSEQINNDMSQLENYNDKLKDLLVKFKLDVANAMGIVVTFGDTDGD